MNSSNFQFLQSQQSELSDLGRSAESYAYSDPQSAVVKLRCFAELYVSYIYEELSLPTYGASNFFERLDNAAFADAVEQCVVEKLHLIRMKGNKAAHLGGVSVDDARGLVKEAWFLGAWLYMAYHGGTVEALPQYREIQPVEPESDALKAELARTKNDLEQQAADLEQAKAELSAAQERYEEQERLPTKDSELNQARLMQVKEAGQRAVASYDFAEEQTRAAISMDDMFAEYQLTNG